MNEINAMGGHQIPPARDPQNLPDLRVSFEGTVVLFHPLTDAAREWLRVHCPADENHQYLCGALFVDSRYVENLIRHAREDGLAI